MAIKEWVKKSPSFIQKPIRWLYSQIPPKYRPDKTFREMYNFLEKSQWWSRQQLEEYQLKKIQEMLTMCQKHSPFYQKRWKDAGIDISTIKSFQDFTKVPYTTKEDLKKYADEMVPDIFNKDNLIKTRTGGTTGSPANFYLTKDVEQKETAFFVLYWSWHGCNFFKTPMAFFRGSYEEKEEIEQYGNKYYLPIWNLTQNKIRYYIDFINKEKIQFIHGYPSMIYELFRRAKIDGKRINLKGVFFASEKPYQFQKDFIEKNFSVPVYAHYGHNETSALFMQCKYNNAYHIIPQYGYVEFEPLEGTPYHEIIATGFINKATPLIRYRTEDYVILQKDTPCPCKREYPKIVKDIIGRTGDLIYTPKGTVIQPNHLEYAIRFIKHFKDCQVVQDRKDHIKVLIVPDEGYTSEEGEEFKKAIMWRLKEDMNIDIEIVDKISRPINMKKRFTLNLTLERKDKV